MLQGGELRPGGVALLWKENNLRFEVKLVLFHGPNTLTFQLRMGDKQLYIIGTYIPPNCTRGGEDIQQAVEACPVGYKLLVMGDLNANIGFPRDKWEEVIVNLFDGMCLVDLSCRYWLWTPCRTATRARWTWSQKRRTTWHFLQPDYIVAQAEEMGMFTGVVFCF